MTKKKNKIQGIDEFYCINLKHRKDKKKLVLREFKKLNLEKKIKFVDGIFMPNNGHLGCMLSHKLIIKNALSKKFKRILVFEDDVIIKSGSLLIKQLKGLIKNNVTIGYLGGTFVHPRAKIRNYNSDFYIARQFIYSAYAVIYSENIFEELLKNMESIERDIEEKKCTFDRILGAKIQPKYFCLIPKKIQIEQRTNLSDTENQIKGLHYQIFNQIGFYTCRYAILQPLHFIIFQIWSKLIYFNLQKILEK